jgi:hypothetical protein
MARAVTERGLHFSDVRVDVRTNSAQLDAALQRRWGGAARSMLPALRSYRMDVDVGERLRIAVDDEVLWNEPLGPEPESLTEFYLYRGMLAEHRRRYAVFHGAAVTSDRHAWVFCGTSGAGKSTVSTAALRRGCRYFTDEFVVTDGKALWGWPRTPEVDVRESTDARRPRWLHGFEPVDAHGAARYPLHLRQVATHPVSAKRVHFVHLQSGITTWIRPISTTEALRHWHEAAFYDCPVTLGEVVGPGRVWHAQWRDPDELLDELERGAQGALDSRAPALP